MTLLRDTGVAQSLILKDVIDLPPCTVEENSVLIEGVGGEYRSVPLHRVFLFGHQKYYCVSYVFLAC